MDGSELRRLPQVDRLIEALGTGEPHPLKAAAARQAIGEAREALSFARMEARQYADAMTDLLGITISPAQELMWLREFIPEPPTGITSDRVAKNIEEARAAVMGFLNGPAVEGTGVRGTAYGLVQAAGEYLDHVRTARSWETRLNRTLIRPEPLKHRALTIARNIITTAS